MTFEWDSAKSARTKKERGFDFDYAATVFLDENRVEGFNREAQDGELRHYTIGRAAFSDVLFVVFTERKYEEQAEAICRIISARRANKAERRRYQELR